MRRHTQESLVERLRVKIETRSWATSYRGPLLIHAGPVSSATIIDEAAPAADDEARSLRMLSELKTP